MVLAACLAMAAAQVHAMNRFNTRCIDLYFELEGSGVEAAAGITCALPRPAPAPGSQLYYKH